MEELIASATAFLIDWGYFGLFISAFLAGSIVPFSSEVVMVVLLKLGLDPAICILSATAGNTAGGVTCYWIGHLGKMEWIEKYLGVKEVKLALATKFLQGRGALMGFFAFLPVVGELVAIALGFMRSNVYLTSGAMFVGKLLRYLAVYATFQGAISLL